jgi:hypothetical protein
MLSIQTENRSLLFVRLFTKKQTEVIRLQTDLPIYARQHISIGDPDQDLFAAEAFSLSGPDPDPTLKKDVYLT